MATNTNGSSSRASSDSRLASLEAKYSQVSDDVQALRSDFGSFAAEMRNAIADIRRTPWGDMAKWASVVLTMVALVGGLVAFGMNAKIDDLYGQIKSHEALEAHPAALRDLGKTEIRIERVEGSVVKLDEILQREMRLLDQTLQNEFGGWIEGLQKQIDSTSKVVETHDGVLDLLARIDERVKALEKSK